MALTRSYRQVRQFKYSKAAGGKKQLSVGCDLLVVPADDVARVLDSK